MNCPVCESRMKTIEKYGVELDICPDCKGVWLDRGELEKIVEMEGGEQSRHEAPEMRHEERRPVEPDRRHEPESREHGERDEHGYSNKPRRRGSFLGDILDAIGGGGD